jgi:poly(A) polymerase
MNNAIIAITALKVVATFAGISLGFPASLILTALMIRHKFDLNNIMSEFCRAHEILKNRKEFTAVFDSTDFFKRYRLFIDVEIRSEDAEESIGWNGYIESKIRILAAKLEGIECIQSAIPFPKGFRAKAKYEDRELEAGKKRIGDDMGAKIVKRENNCFKCNFFVSIEVEINKMVGTKLYIDEPIQEFLTFVNSWEHKTEGMGITIKARKRKDVEAFLRECEENEFI